MSDKSKLTADLAAELADYKQRMADMEVKLAELAKLAEAAKPPEPFKPEPHRPYDPTANATMDRETMKDFAKAIPPELARDLRADLARGNPLTAPVAQLTPDRGAAVQRGSGYRDAVPLSSPPGVGLADRIMDMADAIDKAELARRLSRTKEKG